MNTLISIIIPTYNRGGLILASLKSILEQTHQNFEIIVVDDASTDNTKEIIASLKDPRIHYYRHEKNRGAPAARNTGIGHANGEFIAFLDSDDVWKKDKLEKQLAKFTLSSPETALVYTGMTKVDETGKILGYKMPEYEGKIFNELLRDNVVGSTSVAMVRKSALLDVGGFDEAFRSRQDLDLWLRIAKKYRIAFVSEPLVDYLVHSNRISGNPDAKLSGCMMILEKYHADMEGNAPLLAQQYYNIAYFYRRKGNVREALHYFSLVLKNKFRIKAFIYFIELGIKLILGKGTSKCKQ